MGFRKYMHIERFGTDEVQGIELGGCYVFPKLDGTNGSAWWDEDGVHCGSRNRELTLESDNAGFFAWAIGDTSRIPDFFISRQANKSLRLYGEFLVPHSLKTYREDAWRKFYVFDVFDDATERYLPYDEYQPLMEECGIDYIPPLCVMKNATYDALLIELKNNGFLIRDGEGQGEGIVIKNYDFQNRFGRACWAKIVTNEFKEKHSKLQPTEKLMRQMTERVICEEFLTKPLVDKVYAKIVNEMDGWNSKYIPRLLGTVYYDLVNEETWNAVKKLKNPTVNFKTLNSLAIIRVKELRPELF